MFGKKCSRCGKRVSKKYEFCPSCGLNLKTQDNDYGFLGKNDLNDFDNFGIKMPFGFNALFKSLTKELARQMNDLDEEFKKEQRDTKEVGRTIRNFSISVNVPGQKPIRIQGSQPIRMNKISHKIAPKILTLPKVQESKLEKAKNFPRKEAETNVRRLGDVVIYELKLPNVNSFDNINISQLEEGIEIKAIAKDVVFTKMIDVKLPIINFSFADEKLIFELMAK